MAQTNIIELNGKRYDAATGEFLGHGATAGLQHAELRRAHHGRSMDIMRPAHAAKQTHIAEHAVHRPKPAAPKTVAAAKKPPVVRSAKVIAAHQPQKSTMLMRTAVKKPTFKMKPAIKTQAPSDMIAAPVATIAPKASAYRLEPRRAARAHSVARSQHVRRFAADRAVHNVSVPIAEPVTAAPAPLAFTHAAPTPRSAERSVHHVNHSNARRAAPAKSPASHDIFEAAIAHASSHLEPAPKISRHRSRWLHVTAVAVTFLAIGGAVMWANKANIEVHFASMRAGFHIMMPTYAPDGYALTGNVQANNGKVTLAYRSGNASYSITEQASSWDSATLASSTVALQHAPQVMQTAGRTVYLYGNGNAMWVDGGVLYNLVANGSLTNAEIANLVAGL